MNKQDVIDNLNLLEKHLISLNASLKKVKSAKIYKKALKDSAQALARKWFEEVELAVQHYGISGEVKTKYHELFTTLLSLSAKNSRKSTYAKTITEILADFKDDLLPRREALLSLLVRYSL